MFTLRTKLGYVLEQVFEPPLPPPSVLRRKRLVEQRQRSSTARRASSISLTTSNAASGNYCVTFTQFFCFSLFTVDGSLSDTAVSSINDPYRSSMPGPGILQKGGGPGGVVGGNTTPGGGVGGMGKKSNSTSQLSAAGKGHATQLAPPLQDLKPTDDMRDLPPSVPLQMLSGSDNQGTFIVFHWVTGALFGNNGSNLLPLL